MLGADVAVLEDAGLFLGEDDDLPGPFREALEHASIVSRPVRALVPWIPPRGRRTLVRRRVDAGEHLAAELLDVHSQAQ